MSDVRLAAVTKAYGDDTALSAIDLACADGTLLVVFGPSGAGKSTLLKLVAGIEDPSEGRVWIAGRDVTAEPPQRRDIAMAFESYALYPHLSVWRNLEFPLRAPGRGLAAIARAERIREVAGLLEIDELLERRPGQLSGGQRQRVSLGRALVRDANATLLDEPIAHLDARLRNSLRGELKHYLRSHGATALYATPDYVEAFGIADVVAILVAGRLHQVGPPEEIYEAPSSLAVAELVGDPRMNVFAVEADGTLRIGGYRRRLPLADAPGTVGHAGFRPADVAVAPESSDDDAPGRVELIEPAGDHRIVRIDADGTAVTAKIAAEDAPFAVGDTAWVRLDWSRAHYFDRAGLRHAAAAAREAG